MFFPKLWIALLHKKKIIFCLLLVCFRLKLEQDQQLFQWLVPCMHIDVHNVQVPNGDSVNTNTTLPLQAYAAAKFADACLRGLRGDAGIIECSYVASQVSFLFCIQFKTII